MNCNRALLLPPLLLAACAAPQGEYPSLALRPAERVAGTAQPVAAEPYVPPPTPAAVLGRLGQLTAEAASAHRAFLAQAPAARGAVAAARGGEVGSDAWSLAQVALAGLDAARGRSTIALADLDRLYVDAAVAGGDLQEIGTARDTVASQVDEQNAAIDGLLAQLN